MDGDQFEAAMTADATIESVEAIAEKKRADRKAENDRLAAESQKQDTPDDVNDKDKKD